MNVIGKIFGILIVLILVNLGASNSDIVTFRFWPFDFGVAVNFGFCLVFVFLIAFLFGGLYICLNGKKKLKKTKNALKSLQEKLNDAEKK